MDALAVQEAKKASKKVGDIKQLLTEERTNTVAAINEINSKITNRFKPDVKTMELLVDSGQTKTATMPFISKGYITGIKVTGSELTGEFSLKIFTKSPNDGGTYIYHSGRVNNIIWDVPENDIPFFDESGTNTVYLELKNNGTMTNFKIQVFVLLV